MAASLSAYWVKFFKGAGFPQDVATKHAVVFSNNRIKPDMLPDLDKPSLKEMGITLMGDMIAILRYAKKVVEETTCERFLVDTEDSVLPVSNATKPIVKKVAKANSKTSLASKVKVASITSKVLKTSTPSIKKVSDTNKLLSDSAKGKLEFEVKKAPSASLKRKINDIDYGNDDEWLTKNEKQSKLVTEDVESHGYKVILAKNSNIGSRQIIQKPVESKRTVFDRLGDSSVTSTTNLAEVIPTFNITGLGKDVFKRTSSVFNRLGDKDAKKDSLTCTGILKNGASDKISTQGILKTNISTSRSTTTKKGSITKLVSKPIGTMHADHEKNNKKAVSNSIKQLVKTTNKLNFDNKSPLGVRHVKFTSNKLASERLKALPAKARLGAGNTKQVTFNRVTTVANIKKPDVFSRLGV
ncbi:uncharacterized protein C19orf47 [Prorops nasuta]|uniref:uncharacterized protein C19orf47 n=1 Tax=Prorops nasuta TaxID=863751 RepID=UPI0034CDED49